MHIENWLWKFDISVEFLKLKILPLYEYIHILYHWKAETLQITVLFESSHLVKHSLNYGDVNRADMLTTPPPLHAKVDFQNLVSELNF